MENDDPKACFGNDPPHKPVADISVHQYKRNVQVPKTLVYHIHMQSILSGHCTVDLNLSDEINKCVQYYERVHHVNFANLTLYTRKQLVQLLASLYNLHKMKPTIIQVRLTDSRIPAVPSFDLRSMLYSILTDSS